MKTGIAKVSGAQSENGPRSLYDSVGKRKTPEPTTALMHIATRPQKPTARTSFSVCSVIGFSSFLGRRTSSSANTPRRAARDCARAADEDVRHPKSISFLHVPLPANRPAGQRGRDHTIAQHRHSVPDALAPDDRKV